MTKPLYEKPDGVTIKEWGEDLSLMDIVHEVTKEDPTNRRKWHAEDRMRAVMAYLITGTYHKAEKATGIPKGTIAKWRKEAPWWPELEAACRKYKDNELEATWTNILHQATSVALERLAEGDYKWDARAGSLVRVPISGRDAILIATSAFDKRALQRGEATSRVERTSSDTTLKQLLKNFEAMAGMNARTINGEVEVEKIEHTDDDNVDS